MYAIIETGGKQYKVTPGTAIEVERLDAAEGSTVELDKVMLVANGDKVTTGSATSGVKVVGTSLGEFKADKIVVFRYRNKTSYHKKTGHRQLYTKLMIDKIVGAGEEAAVEPGKKPRRKKATAEKEVTESGS